MHESSLPVINIAILNILIDFFVGYVSIFNIVIAIHIHNFHYTLSVFNLQFSSRPYRIDNQRFQNIAVTFITQY